MKEALFLCALLLPLIFSGCATGHCDPAGNAINKKHRQARRIFVYKYDGSKQCSPGLGATLEEMAKELDSVKVYSMFKRTDGQMRVQVCGAFTGVANVYEIKQKDLALAEALGFKKWDF